MARDIRTFTATIPAGTAQATPVTVALAMPPRIVRHIDIRVPPGPSGLMGFALAAAGVPILPSNAGGWIITDDEAISWDVAGQITSGAWQLIGYNTGTQPHSIYLRFLLDVIGADTPAPLPDMLSAQALSPVPDAAAVILTPIPGDTQPAPAAAPQPVSTSQPAAASAASRLPITLTPPVDTRPISRA